MFRFPSKSLFVVTAAAGLVLGGAGAASAHTSGGEDTSVEDSGNVVLEDLVDANTEGLLNDNLNGNLSGNVVDDNDLLSDNIVNDTLDVGDILGDNEVDSDS